MKTALVTGAGRGIGLNLVKDLSDKGYQVFAVTRSATPELKAVKNVQILVADVSTNEGVGAVARSLEGRALDLLINNAGVMLDGELKFENFEFDRLRETFLVNVETPMKLTQALLPQLQKSNEPVVAHVTSKMGSIQDNASGGYYAYRMSKTALNMFNKSFSVDFPKITSLVLHPGWVQTQMGGSNAPTTTAESSQGMLKVIEKATLKDSGKFYSYLGETIPW